MPYTVDMLDQEMLEETYELAKSNNKMLRKMRRNAFIGGVFKLIIWVALLGIPIWIYFTFFQPVINDLLNTMGQVQRTGEQIQQAGTGASVQLQEFRNLLGNLPGIGG